VFENGVLRYIFGPKREEVTEDCKRVHEEEIHDPYRVEIHRKIR